MSSTDASRTLIDRLFDNTRAEYLHVHLRVPVVTRVESIAQ
jgi:hypothetical protein